jgi:hypothetical protein
MGATYIGALGNLKLCNSLLREMTELFCSRKYHDHPIQIGGYTYVASPPMLPNISAYN